MRHLHSPGEHREFFPLRVDHRKSCNDCLQCFCCIEMECTSVGRTGGWVGLGTPGRELSGWEEPLSRVRVNGVVVFGSARQEPQHGLGVGRRSLPLS